MQSTATLINLAYETFFPDWRNNISVFTLFYTCGEDLRQKNLFNSIGHTVFHRFAYSHAIKQMLEMFWVGEVKADYTTEEKSVAEK
jgi:hypothetical protein